MVVRVERIDDDVYLEFPTRVRRIKLPVEAAQVLALGMMAQVCGINAAMIVARCRVPDDPGEPGNPVSVKVP